MARHGLKRLMCNVSDIALVFAIVVACAMLARWWITHGATPDIAAILSGKWFTIGVIIVAQVCVDQLKRRRVRREVSDAIEA
jgi:hypothetical protein